MEFESLFFFSFAIINDTQNIQEFLPVFSGCELMLKDIPHTSINILKKTVMQYNYKRLQTQSNRLLHILSEYYSHIQTHANHILFLFNCPLL